MSSEKLTFLNNGVAQVAIVVPDLEEAVENYWRLFGIGPWHFYTYGTGLCKKMTYHGRPAEYRMRVALGYLGPTRIELIQPLEGDTVYRDFVEEHGYGVHHFGVLVENMEEALAQAEAAGLTMTMDGAGFGRDGDGHYAYLDTEDRIGVTIELIERPRGRMEPEKVYPLSLHGPTAGRGAPGGATGGAGSGGAVGRDAGVKNVNSKLSFDEETHFAGAISAVAIAGWL